MKDFKVAPLGSSHRRWDRQVGPPEPGGDGELSAPPTAGKVQERGREIIDCRKPPFSASACMRCYDWHYCSITELWTESPGQRSPVLVVPNPNKLLLLLIEHEHAKPRHLGRGSRTWCALTSVRHCLPLASCERLSLPHNAPVRGHAFPTQGRVMAATIAVGRTGSTLDADVQIPQVTWWDDTRILGMMLKPGWIKLGQWFSFPSFDLLCQAISTLVYEYGTSNAQTAQES